MHWLHYYISSPIYFIYIQPYAGNVTFPKNAKPTGRTWNKVIPIVKTPVYLAWSPLNCFLS